MSFNSQSSLLKTVSHPCLWMKFILRFDSRNKVLKPDHALFNLRDPFTQDKNLINLFTKYYHVDYVELRLI